MSKPLYSVGTWDTDEQAYTPHRWIAKTFNMTLRELRAAIQTLRLLGYTAHRRGNINVGHGDNDDSGLIERTDGKSEAEILESWLR